MANAVGTDNHVFNPASDDVYINGDFLPGGWANWDLAHLAPYHVTNNPIGSELYSLDLLIPKGTLLALTYKFSINGAENEPPAYVNHLRYVRTLANYAMALDTFGTPVTEPRAGRLAIGPPSDGRVQIS